MIFRPKITIYTDGACSGGRGGWAALLLCKEADDDWFEWDIDVVNGVKGYSWSILAGNVENTTNNRMEILAVVKALSSLTRECEVTLYSDSEYVVLALKERLHTWKQNGWKTSPGESVKNQDLWMELDRVASRHVVLPRWVKGHAENEYNNAVDRWAQYMRTMPMQDIRMDQIDFRIDPTSMQTEESRDTSSRKSDKKTSKRKIYSYRAGRSRPRVRVVERAESGQSDSVPKSDNQIASSTTAIGGTEQTRSQSSSVTTEQGTPIVASPIARAVRRRGRPRRNTSKTRNDTTNTIKTPRKTTRRAQSSSIQD